MPGLRRHRSYSLFASRPTSGAKILFFIVLSIVLMTLDHQYNQLEAMRSGLSTAVYPLRVVATLPDRITREVSQRLSFRSTLMARNAELERRLLKLQARLQQLQALKRENAELRALMNADARTHGETRIARIMSVSLDPFRQQIIINKGTTDNVYIGQPILSANGVMGQITHTSLYTSTALLITDPSAAIPVEVTRNGLRTIAIGTGNIKRLSLPYLPNNADIRVGDQLVTSGLAGRFPRGYPVGTVIDVNKKPGMPFAQVTARPAAHLNRSHEVLLLWPPDSEHSPPPSEKATRDGQ